MTLRQLKSNAIESALIKRCADICNKIGRDSVPGAEHDGGESKIGRSYI